MELGEFGVPHVWFQYFGKVKLKNHPKHYLRP